MRHAERDKSEGRALLARAQAGDERAFRELVEPYRRALQVHCYRMLGSPETARASSRRRTRFAQHDD